MPTYQYNALKMSDRSRVSGVINANTEREAREMLREQELVPTQLKVVTTDPNQVRSKNPIKIVMQLFSGVGSKELITFTRNMSMMFKTGIPVTEALMYFETYMDNPKFKAIIGQIRRDILAGVSMSNALAKHPKVFSDVYVNVTRAGEASGELDATMNRMTDLLTKSEKLKGKVISASIYPAIVMCIMGLVMLVMFLLVIPTFVDVYEKMGIELPLITQIMVAISNFMRGFWFVFFPALGFSIYGLLKYVKSPQGTALLDRAFLKIPVLDELTKFIANSQFISTFHVSFSAGIPIVEALYLSAETIQNSVVKAAYRQVNVQIQAGQRLAIAMASTKMVPDLVLLMISTGEESGELEKMMENAFEYLEEEINQRVEVLTAMLEPIMLVVLGLMVAVLALSIYLPLFSIYENM
ncbi:MAG: type II secretion system F family protein [Candidatus Melainabacteria bacterium]|nr:type II secretion system F family protein [Candidatus Melainabacteria bacterium]